MDAAEGEYRCFIGGLSWNTTDRSLETAFSPFGNVVDAKVVLDRETNRSRGFGFVTFEDERSMENAIEKMHNKEMEGRTITVSKAQPKSAGGGGGGGGDRYGGGGGGDRYGGGGGGDRRGSRDYGGGGGGGPGAGGECFKCGQRGHWARDCPSGGGGFGGRRGGSDRYEGGGGGGRDRYGSDRGGDRYGSDSSRGGGGRYSGDRGSDRYGGGSRGDNGRSSGARSGPYDRPKQGRGSYDDRY